MKFTLATLALISIAYSQTIASEVAQLPACALTCLAPAITGAGCGLTDYACQCGTANAAIAQAATPCIITGCSSDDALKSQSLSTEICNLANVAAVSGSSSAAPAAPASSASSMASSMAASGSSMASSMVSSASSRASSATSAVSSAVSSASSRASSAAPGATSTRATSSAPATATTNAADKKSAGGLVAGAAVLMAFAL